MSDDIVNVMNRFHLFSTAHLLCTEIQACSAALGKSAYAGSFSFMLKWSGVCMAGLRDMLKWSGVCIAA